MRSKFTGRALIDPREELGSVFEVGVKHRELLLHYLLDFRRGEGVVEVLPEGICDSNRISDKEFLVCILLQAFLEAAKREDELVLHELHDRFFPFEEVTDKLHLDVAVMICERVHAPGSHWISWVAVRLEHEVANY